MNIVLATGIYPPDIGGPATYVRKLAEELTKRGEDVTVLTYARGSGVSHPQSGEQSWTVVRVSKSGGPLLRWRRYAQALREHARTSDVVECFSSVSCGIPLRMARLKKPRKLLRLGGDFAWERYTDIGGKRPLRVFMTRHPRARFITQRILKGFHHIIFSTRFQEHLYELAYHGLPGHSVIENAVLHPSPLPQAGEGTHVDEAIHQKHEPLRLLFFGRFVPFKNLERLLRAVANVPLAKLTMVGEGPQASKLSALARSLQLQGRVNIIPPVHGGDVQAVFAEHDLLILPSLTEISPNAALEARAAGLPVLLTEENGLSEELRSGMMIRPLLTTNDITKAILEVDRQYDELAQEAANPFAHERGWDRVAEEHLGLFRAQ